MPSAKDTKSRPTKRPRAAARAVATQAPPDQIRKEAAIAAGKFGSSEGEAAFRTFQSNLVSLISHELRTPLTSVVSALALLQDTLGADFGGTGAKEDAEATAHDLGVATELIRLARRNADKLQHALTTIFDVGALEEGTVRIRLREIALDLFVKGRLKELLPLLETHSVVCTHETATTTSSTQFPTLADPRRLARAFDLAVQMILFRMAPGSKLEILTTSHAITFRFELTKENRAHWDAAWQRILAGESTEAFAGVRESEEGFLTRMDEGLGNELFLIQEILNLHQGKISFTEAAGMISFRLELPTLSSEEGLLAVLSSRAYESSTELASVAFALIRVAPNESIDSLRAEIQKILFRSSDAVYALPERMQIAIVLGDCKAEDAPGLLRRMEAALNRRLIHGIAHCPTDGIDPNDLIELAQSRLKNGSPLSTREH